MSEKIAKVKLEDVESVETFQVELKCPYCKWRQTVERDFEKPIQCVCERCEKKFKIEYEDD